MSGEPATGIGHNGKSPLGGPFDGPLLVKAAKEATTKGEPNANGQANLAKTELTRAADSRNATIEEIRARTLRKLERELGFVTEFLEEPGVQEIFCNPDGTVIVDRAGQPKKVEGTLKSDQVAAFLQTVASTINTPLTPLSPSVDGVLMLDGSRISGEIPPIVTAPSFRIRRHSPIVYPLERMVETGTMTQAQFDFLVEAIRAKRNIVIAGGTGSGKTFFGNSLLHKLADVAPGDRVLSIEDTAELRLSSPDRMSWVTTETVDMQKMLVRALRATPDRIVVGEVRSKEAYQLLKMWQTGHDGGFATIHSSDGELDALARLERMCGEAPECDGKEDAWIKEIVADVVDIIVYIVKLRDGGRRIVPRMVEVRGFDRTSRTYDTHLIERDCSKEKQP